MGVEIKGSVQLVLKVQEKLSTNAPGPDNTTVQIDNISLALFADATENAAYLYPNGEARVEIAGLRLTNWWPNQRFRLTLEPIDPGMC